MLSGVTSDKHGITWNYYDQELGFIQVPTVFSQAKAAGLTTAMFLGKIKLKHLAAPATLEVFQFLGGDDLAVANAAAQHVITSKPKPPLRPFAASGPGGAQ